MHRSTQRRLGTLVLIPLLALVAACGGNDSGSDSSAGSAHNDADVSFATDMIPHHSQAIEMADLALVQAQSPDVLGLAKQIKQAQDPEITRMSSWLESWGEPTPDTSMGSMSGMDHGDGDDGSMPGMMTSDDLQRLGSVSGAEFDRMWLQMMTEHHEGAVEMSKTELRDGESTDATSLAQTIVDAQEAEISTMHELLGKNNK